MSRMVDFAERFNAVQDDVFNNESAPVTGDQMIELFLMLGTDSQARSEFNVICKHVARLSEMGEDLVF